MIRLIAVSANEKVYRTGPVPELETPVYLFPGSEVHFQLTIVPEEEYRNAALRLTGGPAARGASMRRVGFVPSVTDASPAHDDYYVIREDHLYPDVLESFDPSHMHGPGGCHQTVFVTVKDRESIPVGRHTLTARFFNDGKVVARARITLIKMPEPLPPQRCILTHWMHYDAFVQQHHVRLFTRDFYRLFASYLGWAAACGQNMLLVPLFTPAFDTQIGGERETAQLLDIREAAPGQYTFDFRRTNEFIAFARAHGMQYLEMPPFFTQWAAKHAPKILVRDTRGRLRRRFGWDTDALSEEYRSFLRQLLEALHENLCRIGMEENTFYHISDEPNLEQYEQYMACKDFIRPLIGRSRMLDACSELEFAGRNEREYSVCSVATVDRYITAGVRPLCTYYCCGPVNGHFTNRFLSMPLARTSVLGLQMYRYDMALFLHWGFNFYNSFLSRRPICPYNTTDADGMFTGGDAFIVYPDYAGFGANPSLRLMAMGEGMRLFRMLALLEEKEGREAALAFLDAEGVRGLTEYPTETGWLDRLTARLASRLYPDA